MKYVNIIFLLVLLASCWKTIPEQEVISEKSSVEAEEKISEITDISNTAEITFADKDIDIDLKNSDTVFIELNSENTHSDNSGVQISEQQITIKKSGNYEFSWVLDDGQIVVETEDEKDVQIILNNVNISNNFGPAIFIKNTSQAVITLAENSKNILSDGDNYSQTGDDMPNASIYSTEDLVIMWEGSLEVIGNYNDGITSKDKLFIAGWNISVTSKDDGIRGKDYLLIDAENINITAEWDALKADNEEKGTIIINGGNIEMSAGDDAIHGEIYVEINDGDILITQSYEGIESKSITINGWNINLTSSDDGINVAGWDNEAGWAHEASSENQLIINGGTLVMDAQGDGLDSNGYITMNGWDVIVYGPNADNNGPLDYNGDFNMVWGSLIAIGSSGMAQNIGTSSTQYWVLFGFDETLDAGTTFTLKDSSGNIVATVTGAKTFQSTVVSNDSLKKWETYTSYIWGEIHETFTIESITTTIGTIGWGGRWNRVFSR